MTGTMRTTALALMVTAAIALAGCGVKSTSGRTGNDTSSGEAAASKTPGQADPLQT